MNLEELKEIMRHVVENDISEFEYETSDLKIRIKRGMPAASQPTVSSHSAAHSAPSPEPTNNLRSGGLQKTAPAEDLHIVTSPLVGTFYRAPNPNAEPFVEIGDMVEEETILCIIEAMKLMNEIKSNVTGEVVEIFAQSGQPVEYGQQLFAIRKGDLALNHV